MPMGPYLEYRGSSFSSIGFLILYILSICRALSRCPNIVMLKYWQDEFETFLIRVDPTFTGIAYALSMILINFKAVVAKSDTFSPGNEERERGL